MVIEIADENFEDEVLKSKVPVVVDFWAPWCGPCMMIAPITEKLSKEYKCKVKFCKLNVDENPLAARKYQVMSIPLLLFFNSGVLRLRPDIHAKGTDYTKENVPERSTVLQVGGRIEIVGDEKCHATRDLVEVILAKFSSGK